MAVVKISAILAMGLEVLCVDVRKYRVTFLGASIASLGRAVHHAYFERC